MVNAPCMRMFAFGDLAHQSATLMLIQHGSVRHLATTHRTKFPRHPKRQLSNKMNDPRQWWPLDRLAAPHIRACLSRIADATDELAQRETGFSVCTLGTGTGHPSLSRNQSATVIRNLGTAFLVDSGEGVQRQFLSSRINFRDIEKIFSTCSYCKGESNV